MKQPPGVPPAGGSGYSRGCNSSWDSAADRPLYYQYLSPTTTTTMGGENMAKVTTGSTFGLNTQEAVACEMLARGETEADVMMVLWGFDYKNATPSEKHTYTKKLHAIKRKPGFKECFETIVRLSVYEPFARAKRRIERQIDSENEWVANKASNDFLNRYGHYVDGTGDSKEIVVRIEGAPKLGSPDE